MKTITRTAVLLVGLLAVTGCTRTVDGAVRPAPGLTPQPVIGNAVKQVLPDGAQLEKMYDQQFRKGRVTSGGFDALPGYSSEDSSECTGVVRAMSGSSYQGADVLSVAMQEWQDESDYSNSPTLIAVEAGVVSLKSAKEADAQFAEISERWQQCDGSTVELYSYSYPISDVQVADSVVSARTDWGLPVVRALGVRVNCLVEIELTYYTRTKKASLTDTRAVDLAHAMMDKVSELS